MRELADEYYALAEEANFDYAAMLEQNGEEVQRILDEAKATFVDANPAYEEMEGIVAGVPRLAQYDVDIDAGADASDPENAVSFSLDLQNGETLKQPGNLFFVLETALYGTNPDFLAEGVDGDVDGNGKVDFGEGVPDADIFAAAAAEFESQAQSLDEDAQAFEPTPSDAFTAITVMTPTMSEYFEAWKNSRFIAGENATELGFVATSRLSDIADILEGLVLTYDQIEPQIAAENPQQAEQTKQELDRLLAFVEDLRDQEVDGKKYTAEEADTLGAEAQRQAEAIAGQITQAAQQLNIELQEVIGISGTRHSSSRACFVLSWAALPGAAHAQAPWQQGEQIRNGLFDAQTSAILEGGAGAAEDVAGAEAAISGKLERQMAEASPASLADLRAAVADAGTAVARRRRGRSRGRARPSARRAAPRRLRRRGRRHLEGRGRARPRLAPDPRLPPGHALHAARRGRDRLPRTRSRPARCRRARP